MKKIIKSSTYAMIACMALYAVKVMAASDCTTDAPAKCHTKTGPTKTLGCTITTPDVAYTLCSSGGSGTGCTAPADYDCSFVMTATGTLCGLPKTQKVPNTVSQTTSTGTDCK